MNKNELNKKWKRKNKNNFNLQLKDAKSPSCNCLTNIPTLMCHVLHSYWYRLWPWLIWSWFFPKTILNNSFEETIDFVWMLACFLHIFERMRKRQKRNHPTLLLLWLVSYSYFLPSFIATYEYRFLQWNAEIRQYEKFDFAISILSYVWKLK